MSASTISIKFVNNSNDVNDSEILVFQENTAMSYSNIAVAWQVIENFGIGDTNTIYYPYALTVSATDSYNNVMPQLDASPGNAFEVVHTDSGNQLLADGSSTDPSEIDVQNNLSQGAISVSLYRNGALVGYEPNVVPEEMGVFRFLPQIYVGIASNIEQGETLDAATMTQRCTEFDLTGLSSVTITMTGGGEGKTAQPYKFAITEKTFA